MSGSVGILILVCAGIQKPDKYLEKIAEELGKIAGIPGRRRQSLEESSFDAWIKLYRPDENSVNSTISYYLKGGMVALLLDLEIRYRTAGNKSLDDCMRLLWTRFGKEERGFPDDAVQRLMEEASGLELFAYRTDTLCAVVPRRHPVRGRRLAFARLLDHDFVGLESNTVISRLMLEEAERAGKPLRLRVQVKSFDVVARMVQAGLGIGVLPEAAAKAFGRAMGLRFVSLTDPWAARKMYVCVREYASLPASARQLVDDLTANAAA